MIIACTVGSYYLKSVRCRWRLNLFPCYTRAGVSLTKLCNVSYNQLTCRRSHELILRTNCYIALGCVGRAFPCVALRNVVRHELRWYARTGRMNSTYEHLCERPPWSHVWQSHSHRNQILSMFLFFNKFMYTWLYTLQKKGEKKRSVMKGPYCDPHTSLVSQFFSTKIDIFIPLEAFRYIMCPKYSPAYLFGK